MMRFSLFIGISCALLSLSAQNNQKNGPTKIRHSALEMNDGVAMYKGKPFTGLSFISWDNNRINEQFSWVDGLKDGIYKEYTKEGTLVTMVTWSQGVKEGPYEYYYETGAPQSNGHFRRGELDGLVTGYYITGVKKYEVNYLLGIRHGSAKTWFKNGAPEQVAFYVNNLPHGEVLEYYPDSTVYSESEYNMGVRNGRYYQFHRKSGCPAMESYYKNGKLDSVRRVWSEINCFLIQEENYLAGEKHGEFVQYDANGDTLKVENYRYNKLDGPFRQWDTRTVSQNVRSRKTGQDVHLYTLERGVDIIGNYSEGKPDGHWQYGLFTNYQHREGNYDAGVMVGEWLFYDLQGRLLMRQWYDEDGNIKKEKLYKRPRKK